ncbi:hypothetical protein CLV62_104140 [Dysgonomonas alginatilytica]|uniref:Uncharacterized protein n=1 Tax=Dysgonomonas alginatilytica TaxID=1605892 RepID=A0A2V3PSV8_9BACT|nr:hypothetical protein [Dysgonomonas alginatilytica]PXV66879.1 hypothetical protein CLV62_104140 [Dysgonomonas alginatilytica]
MKKLILLLFIINLSYYVGFAQNNYSENNDNVKCSCCKDSLLNEPVFLQSDTPPRLPDNQAITDIVIRDLKIPLSLVDENGDSIYVRPLTIYAIIDSKGNVVCYGKEERRKKSKNINKCDGYVKLVLASFSKVQQWIPASQDGINIAYKLYIPFNPRFRR